jgi:hypothetical protein
VARAYVRACGGLTKGLEHRRLAFRRCPFQPVGGVAPMGQVRELNHSRRPFDVRHCRAYTILALRALSALEGHGEKKHRQGTVDYSVAWCVVPRATRYSG